MDILLKYLFCMVGHGNEILLEIFKAKSRKNLLWEKI